MIGILLMIAGVALMSLGWFKTRVIDAKGESLSNDWWFWTVIDWAGFLILLFGIMART